MDFQNKRRVFSREIRQSCFVNQGGSAEEVTRATDSFTTPKLHVLRDETASHMMDLFYLFFYIVIILVWFSLYQGAISQGF